MMMMILFVCRLAVRVSAALHNSKEDYFALARAVVALQEANSGQISASFSEYMAAKM